MNFDAEDIKAIAVAVANELRAGQGSVTPGDTLTSKEVMALLGYKNRKQFWISVRAARLPFVRINARQIIFQRSALEAWMQRRTRNAA